MIEALHAPDAPPSVASPATSGASPELVEAARQFESLLLHMMIKSMRESIPRSDLFGDSQHLETYEMMRDQELAQSMASGGGIGFARMILDQFEGREAEGLRTLSTVGQRLRSAAESYQNYGVVPSPAPVNGGER